MPIASYRYHVKSLTMFMALLLTKMPIRLHPSYEAEGEVTHDDVGVGTIHS